MTGAPSHLRMLEEQSESMANLQAGESAIIVKMANEEPSILEQLAKLGLRPGACIEVPESTTHREVVGAGGDGENHGLSREVASTIKVKRPKPIQEDR